MDWRKTKNFIIVLLAITNLFLMSFVVSELADREQQQQQARELAVAFLADKGVEIPLEIVPRTMTLQGLELVWDRSDEAQRSGAVLGAVEQENLGGGIVRYSNPTGELRFHSGGEFYGEFTGIICEGDPEVFGLALLKKLNFNGQLQQVTKTGELEVYTYIQTYNDVPLIGTGASLHFREGKLEAISNGKQLVGEFRQNSAEMMTVPTALMKFYEGCYQLGDICREVRGIESMYYISTKLSGTEMLTPIWRMETDTATYLLDITTGGLSRESG